MTSSPQSSNTISTLQQKATQQLANVSHTPVLDAEILLAWVLGKNRAYILAHGSDMLSAAQQEQFEAAITKRKSGVPLPYITGKQEFYGREFTVDKRVLVPRPETERLIEHVLAYISTLHIGLLHIVDIGTGSGCVAITLAAELPNAVVTATDISNEALNVAQKNAQIHKTDVTFLHGDTLEPLATTKQQFNIIVSNPPYVNFEHVNEESVESLALQHEPRIALTPESDDPFSTVQHIITQSKQHIAQHGALFIEIGSDQGSRSLETATNVFPNAKITVHKDLADKDRLLSVTAISSS